MSIQELVAMIAATKVDATELDELNEIMTSASKDFEEKAQSSSLTSEFLSRTYSL